MIFVFKLFLLIPAKFHNALSKEKVREMLSQIIASCFDYAKEQQEAQGQTVLERDFATITLPDVDVPFYSLYLWAGALSHACEHQSLSIVSHDLTLFIDLS